MAHKMAKNKSLHREIRETFVILELLPNYHKPKFIHKGMTISQQISIIFELQHLFPLTGE